MTNKTADRVVAIIRTLTVVCVVAIIIGIAFSIISAMNHHQTASNDLTANQKHIYAQAFEQGCTDNGGSSSFCQCTATKVAQDLDQEKLNHLHELTSKNDEDALVAYATPYAVGCTD